MDEFFFEKKCNLFGFLLDKRNLVLLNRNINIVTATMVFSYNMVRLKD